MSKTLVFIEDYKRFMKNYIINLTDSLKKSKISFIIYGSHEFKMIWNIFMKIMIQDFMKVF